MRMHPFLITLAVILCSNLLASADLTLSKDSIIAFNGKLWNWGHGDDSIEITNVSDKKTVIDSIKIVLPEKDYPEFQISWIVKLFSKDTQYVQAFNSPNRLSPDDCPHKGITLAEYTSLPEKDKLTIGANNTITI